MERNLERQTLSFSKGMTNVPSDLLSDDSELLESDGFIFKDGEMKAVQKGVSIGNVPYKIMYVHKMADYENIIAYDGTTNIYWYTKDDSGNIVSPLDGVTKSFNVGTVYDVNSIGNTLVCATSEGIHYLLYKGNKYKDLGKELPRLDYNFTFERPTGNYRQEESGRTLCNAENAVETKRGESYFNPSNHKFIQAGGVKPDGSETKSYTMFSIKVSSDPKYENEFQETIQGHVAQAINWVKSKNMFAFPFFLRCAFRMFDGSYCRITTPIICYPTVNKNCMFSSAYFEDTSKTYSDYHQMDSAQSMFYFIEYRELLFWFESISSDWSDIIKEIVVFASDQVVPFYIDKGWHFESPNGIHNKYAYANFGYKTYEEKLFTYDVDASTSTDTSLRPYTRSVHDELLPKYKSDDQIINELLTKTVFYKLFTVPISNSSIGGSNYHYTVTGMGGEPAFISDGTLENLQEQEQLKVDDYYGWASLSAKSIYNYNGRLNLIGATRTHFAGFNKFVGKDPTKDYDFLMFTHIISDKCDTWVKGYVFSDKDFLQGWLFYPDPNATEVIFKAGEEYIRIKLKAHLRLNGAYTFPVLPPNKPQEFTKISDSDFQKIVTSVNDKEDLNSQIFTSVVNNPFVFEASGDNTVGTGKILGIIANTEAVSQGQFGQYPLMVFTGEGIYGLSVNSEGLYSRAYPISREVCNEDSPLVPTDRLVFFASKKGLMAASGGSVACMSEQMRGRVPRNFATFGEGKFLDFLKDCFIAYDYRDSILRIFSKGKSYQYIYNMVDKTFSMVNSGIEAQAVVNDYPDNLIQDTNGNVYSLTSKPDINEDTESYSGSFTTRPLKLGGSMTLKSLRAVKHLFDSDEGTIGLEIYGSNDCKHWCKLPSVGGKPWKYFTFKYTLQNFKAADSFAGSIVEVQSRREDKMR